MHTPISPRKRQLAMVARIMQFLEILFSLVIAVMASIYIGIRYYYTFDEGSARLLFVMSVSLSGLLSYVTLSIFTSWWNNRALKSIFQKRVRKDSQRIRKTGAFETTVTCSDPFIEEFVNELETCHTYHTHNYKTVVDETFPNQFKFQTTGLEQPTSQQAAELNAEFIKKRLLEKETRIIEVVDVNIAKKPDHMYDFSATIFVSANSLMKAADIVDSANSILENEFNIKETRLIPVIYS